ncbi:acid phosphatase/Vanadium-dependent haloperoxidase [Meredithblackwellia eburnea MCA 4105]
MNHTTTSTAAGHNFKPAVPVNSRPDTAVDVETAPGTGKMTMAALGAIGLGVYSAEPAPTRSFAVTFRDGEIVYPQFAYPLRREIIPIWAAALIAWSVPTVLFFVCQIRVRSFEDLNCAEFGLLYSLINAAVFQVFIKWLIGGLRPHFLTVCAPVIDPSMIGTGFQELYFTRAICTGDKKQINDSLESMPSGHSTAAWAGLLFLALYLNGKLKLFSDYRPQFWKMTAFFAPILGAFLISGALTIDEFHHYYDVIAGAMIGSCSALAAYRMSYASIFDFRFNHIPLPRLLPKVTGDRARFSYSLSEEETGVLPFTSAGGWRDGVRAAGAPGDALKFGIGRQGETGRPF